MKKYIITSCFAILFLIIICIVMYLSKDSVSVTENIKNQYQEIHDIDGVSFLISKEVIQNSVPLSKLSKDAKYKSNYYYIYSEQPSNYMLFKVNGLLVAVQKETNFNFQAADRPLYALNKSVMGLSFKGDASLLDYKSDSSGKTVLNVTTKIAFNTEQTAEYSGKLIVLNQDSEEWAMFVGFPGKTYTDLNRLSKMEIERISESFSLAQSKILQQDEYAIASPADK